VARAATRRRSPASTTATSSSEYFVLDMGREQYGDSILCRFGDKTVLIDAGHPSDFAGQANYDSIPDQLSAILRKRPPFDISLLVVTHAHNDHIGCLPKMVAAGTIRPKFAIVADPDLGFPPGYRDFIDGLQDLEPGAAAAVQRAVAAISEEDHSFLPDAELDAFLDAASTLGARYRDMLDALEEAGTTVFKWGSTDPTELQPKSAAIKSSPTRAM
jgi:ribonuclease BN (tRNA processing enzyme)